PGDASCQYVIVRPATQTTTPMAIAVAMVRRNDEVISCATATGTIIRALTSRTPTTRIASVTVSAATTAIVTLSTRTGRPAARANSSSWHTANRAARSPTPTPRTSTESATVSTTSW